MFENVLKSIRDKIRAKQYVISYHARKEMLEDNLSLDDVELSILTGEIIERQRDRLTAEWKYRVQGIGSGGQPIVVVAKLAPTGKLVVITVYTL